jgi:DNA-binding NtrC family response regulator
MDSPDPDDTELDGVEDITEILAELEAKPPSTGSLKHTLRAIERREYIAALKRANGSPGEAARQLGVTERTFRDKMAIFGLRAVDWRQDRP